MTNIYSVILLAMLVFLGSACSSIQEPTFEGIKDVRFNNMSVSSMEIEGIMIINNPNSFGLDLAAADFKTIIDEIEVAHVLQNYDVTMPANRDFDMPIKITLDISQLYKDNPMAAITKGLEIMKERKLNTHFLGEIKVGKGSAKINVPIDRKQIVEF